MKLRFFLAIPAFLAGILLAIPIILLGLPFWLVAFVTNAIRRLWAPKALPWQRIIEFDSYVGWKPKANVDSYGIADEPFQFTTDSDGWRGKRSLAESQIVVFGDSFGFGYGVDDKQMFTEKVPSLKVKSIGAPGYNMVQELLLMRSLAPRLSGKLVVWFVFLGNDVYENLMPDMKGYRTPFLRYLRHTGDWEIVTWHVNNTAWAYTSRRRNYQEILGWLCRPGAFSDRAFSACEYLIEAAVETCANAGARLAIMTIPDVTQLSRKGLRLLSAGDDDSDLCDPDLPDRRLAAICRGLRVPFVAAKEFLNEKHHKTGDVHWNPRGHQRVAKILAGIYQDYLSGKFAQRALRRKIG